MSATQILKEKIAAKGGAISLEEYMETCLYDPQIGYYMTRTPLGENGDFTTAPEITQLFGEILAAWIVDSWVKMGAPTAFNLVEIGPGRGTLMHDILRTMFSVGSDCFGAAKITLVEVSPHLQKQQQSKLKCYNINYSENIDNINFNLPTILIANEVLDAFPIRQFERLEGKEDSFFERFITEENGQFIYTKNNEKHTFKNTENDIIETQEKMVLFLGNLKEKLTNGIALFIDYGDLTKGIQQDTLQAVKNHQKVSPFTSPGEADLTSQVNFSEVQKTLGNHCSNIVEMGPFLISLGFAVRATQLMQNASEEQKETIEKASHRLLHPEAMGSLFKAVCYQTGNWDIAGFDFITPHENQSA